MFSDHYIAALSWVFRVFSSLLSCLWGHLTVTCLLATPLLPAPAWLAAQPAPGSRARAAVSFPAPHAWFAGSPLVATLRHLGALAVSPYHVFVSTYTTSTPYYAFCFFLSLLGDLAAASGPLSAAVVLGHVTPNAAGRRHGVGQARLPFVSLSALNDVLMGGVPRLFFPWSHTTLTPFTYFFFSLTHVPY